MRVSAWWLRAGAAVAAAILLAVPVVASAAEETPMVGETAATAVEKPNVEAQVDKAAQDEACALLDDPDKRALMDGLLLKLAITCDRTEFLGQVRQEPRMEVGQPDAGTDVPVNNPAGDSGSSTTQSETSLTVSETTGTICSGYNDSYHGVVTSQGYSGFSRSTDGGATFTDGGAFNSSSYGDPSMVWRKSDGYFYYVSLHSSGLAIYRSTDDCQTFQQHAIVHSGGSDDKELTVVDNNPTSPYYGYLYVVWTNFSDGRIWSTTSTNGGTTWGATQGISSSSNVQGAWPAVAPDGTVYASWVEFGSSIAIRVSKSTNGGTSWTAVSAPATGKVQPQDSTATGNCGRAALKGNIRYLPSPQIAVGPDGALHVVYSYDPDTAGSGDTVNVYYRRSTDGGASWEPEVLLNDDGTTRDQFFPTLSVGATNTVSAAWYDRRLDPNNTLVDYYQRFSFDGGVTWEPSVRISDVSTPVYIDPNLATCYHGDYDTQVQTESAALIQWSDDRRLYSSHNDPDVYLDQQAVSTDFLVTAAPRRQAVCAPADGVFTVDVLQFQGFSEQVTLTANNVPAGATSAFSPNPVTPPGTSQLTIGNTGALAFGTYDVAVIGTSTPSSFVHDTGVTLDVFTQAAGSVTLTAPLNGALNQPLRPSFEWTAATQAGTYDLQVATDDAFTNLVVDATGVAGPVFSPTADLQSNTIYYWRARAVNICGVSAWSAAFSFATVALPGDCGLGTTPRVEFTDDLETGATGWSSSGTGNTWALSSARTHSGVNAYFAVDPPTSSDQRLVSPAVVLPADGTALTLQFWNWQQMEDSFSGCWDGGLVEISTDDGSSWTHLTTTLMLTDPYDGPVTGLSNLDGWCGDPQDWLRSVVDIAAYAGQTVRFRFRLGSDTSVSREGWYVDDVVVQSCVTGEPPFFADDFESGTTDAWSAVVP